MTSLSEEARNSVLGALDALRQWSDEVVAANDRCLAKAIDHMATAQRAMGWPDHVSVAARDNLLKTSKLHTEMIDQVADAWEQLLKTGGMPSTLLRGFNIALPQGSRAQSGEAMPEAMQLAEMSLVPIKAWMQAADIWQRQWIEAMTGAVGRS